MVLGVWEKEKALRGIQTRWVNKRGNGLVDYGIPILDHMDAEQFSEWLVRKFGKEYLEPIQLYKDGGGI